MAHRGPPPFRKPTRFQPGGGGVSWFQPAPPCRDHEQLHHRRHVHVVIAVQEVGLPEEADVELLEVHHDDDGGQQPGAYTRPLFSST